MNPREYEILQDRLTKKLQYNPYKYGMIKKRDGYKEGILVAKSILHEFYNSIQNIMEEET